MQRDKTPLYYELAFVKEIEEYAKKNTSVLLRYKFYIYSAIYKNLFIFITSLIYCFASFDFFTSLINASRFSPHLPKYEIKDD